MSNERGVFLSVEGVEGVGKTTAIGMLEALLADRGIVTLRTREPGGTPLAEAIRGLVLGAGAEESVTDTAELLLMFAARAQSVAHVIRPALERGHWVLCDRFTDATLAYQGHARGLPLRRIYELAEWVHGDLWPDTTLLLTAHAETVAARLEGRAGGPDRIEREPGSFFERAEKGYLALAESDPKRYRVVSTDGNLEALRADLARLVDELMAPQNS
ncbi:MAG: dTMP kinase [Pseudomonadota bacterium]